MKIEIVDIAVIGGRTVVVADTDGYEPFPGDVLGRGGDRFMVVGVEMVTPDSHAQNRFGFALETVRAKRPLGKGDFLEVVARDAR